MPMSSCCPIFRQRLSRRQPCRCSPSKWCRARRLSSGTRSSWSVKSGRSTLSASWSRWIRLWRFRWNGLWKFRSKHGQCLRKMPYRRLIRSSSVLRICCWDRPSRPIFRMGPCWGSCARPVFMSVSTAISVGGRPTTAVHRPGRPHMARSGRPVTANAAA